jgi:hypothetical protein
MSGSAKAGTTPRGTRCELRIWRLVFCALFKARLGELFFLLTLTYMDVGTLEVIHVGYF